MFLAAGSWNNQQTMGSIIQLKMHYEFELSLESPPLTFVMSKIRNNSAMGSYRNIFWWIVYVMV